MSQDVLPVGGSSLPFVLLLFRRLVHGFTASTDPELTSCPALGSPDSTHVTNGDTKAALNSSQLQEIGATWAGQQWDWTAASSLPEPAPWVKIVKRISQ